MVPDLAAVVESWPKLLPLVRGAIVATDQFAMASDAVPTNATSGVVGLGQAISVWDRCRDRQRHVRGGQPDSGWPIRDSALRAILMMSTNADAEHRATKQARTCRNMFQSRNGPT